jgi:hypothetical protein
VVATIQRVYSVLTGKELPEEEEEVSSFELSPADTERLVSYNPGSSLLASVGSLQSEVLRWSISRNFAPARPSIAFSSSWAAMFRRR